MTRRPWHHDRRFLPLVVLGVLATAQGVWSLSGGDPYGPQVVVSEVIDGDTIRAGRGWRQTTVRLIGVDTPETVHPDKPVEFFGPEASAFTKDRLDGAWVHLEFDPADRIDAHGRLLAYVFLPDGTLFNQELIRLGYGRAYTRFPFRLQEEFRQAEADARAAGRGLWARGRQAAGAAAGGPIVGNVRSKVYHLPGQAGYDRVGEANRVYFASEEKAQEAGYRRARR